MIALLLLACTNSTSIEGAFDGPVGLGLLHPEDGGPFYEPVAMVASSRSGRLVPLDVKHGSFLADDPSAPFLRASALATGADRILGDLVLWAPDDRRVTAYVADARTSRLLEVPWIVDVDEAGAPVEATASLAGEPTFEDLDGSGDAVEALGLSLRPRGATSETWTLTFDGEVFQVEGSRSGRQSLPALLLQPYHTDDGGLTFTLSGTASAGDRLTIEVDRGVVEHDLGGHVEALHAARAQGLILASVQDPEAGLGALQAFDPGTGEVVSLPLPEGARPGPMAADAGGARVFVADLRAPVAYELTLDAEDPAASGLRVLEMPGPLVDLAWQGDADYEHLFVAVNAENGYRVYDLLAEAWIDLNPLTPEVDAMDLRAPVLGMAASLDPVRLPEPSDWGGRGEQRVVTISTLEGVLWVAEGETGCLARNAGLGPAASMDSESPFVDRGAASDPVMWTENAYSRSIQVNPCAGVVQDESWSATFDEADGSWVVEGSRSGVQAGRAYEDTRYVSDGGEVSFLILAGRAPSTEGDQFRWRTVEGVAKVSGDLNGDNLIGAGESGFALPGRPAAFSYLAGPTGGGWDVVNRKVGVLWPLINDDRVLRVNLTAVDWEVSWD